MNNCLYCGDKAIENKISLKALVDDGYCSQECLKRDIARFEGEINFYTNEISYMRDRKINYENGNSNNIGIKEYNDLKEEISEKMVRKVALEQKLIFMKSMLKTDKLKY